MRRSLTTALIGGLIALSALGVSGVAQAQRGGIPINIESVPPGATVYLDSPGGAPLGMTPLANVRVPLGAHTFIFQLASYEEARLSVTVRRRRETFRAVLRGLGTVEISAGNDSARGATVTVDGRPVGSGPLSTMAVRVTDLQPGRHQVRVMRDGYVTFEQWVDVGGGQVVRVAAMLERAAPDTGSILVSGPSGTPVFVDNQPAGTTPMVVNNVAVGTHTVEIRPGTGQPYSQSVTVLAGQQATVSMPVASGGTLRVIASAPGAVISIDGEAIGPSPASRDGLAAGDHIVEAAADGYDPIQQTVTVASGQQRVVSLQMQRSQGETGRILVQVQPPAATGAHVIIDNEDRGNAPVVFTPPATGPHAIAVHADGYQDFSTTCSTSPGHNCEITATLVPQQVRVRVLVPVGVSGAQLFVDDQLAGPIPYDGTLPAGPHVLEVRAEGYQPQRQQAQLVPSSEVREFDIPLQELSRGPPPEEVQAQERARGAAMTHAAGPLPVNHPTLDVSVGWPYLAELRANVGLLEFLDAGFAIRSFGRLTDFELRARVGYRPLQQVALAVQARFGGSIGPALGFAQPTSYTDGTGSHMWPPGAGDPLEVRPLPATGSPMQYGYATNSGFFSLEALFSLYFGEQGAFTLWVALDVTSDEYAGHPLDSGVYLDRDRTGMNYCQLVPRGTTSALHCPREDFGRGRLGGSLELSLTRNWNLWFLLEGILSSQSRRVLGNLYGIQTADTQFYFRVGTTYKF